MEWLVVGIISVSALIFGWWVRGKELALQAEVRRLQEENARLWKANLELREAEDERIREKFAGRVAESVIKSEAE